MGNIGFPELIVILIIALIVFGAGRLPEIGSAIGKSIKEFKKAMKEDSEEDKKSESKEEKK
jgi:sec-independent protein translocase protein TatA